MSAPRGPRFGCYDGGPPVKTCACWECLEAFPDGDVVNERYKVLMALIEKAGAQLEAANREADRHLSRPREGDQDDG